MTESTEKFSVYQFFADGTTERVRYLTDIHDATDAFGHYTHSVAAQLGIVNRVIITDVLDLCVAEWVKDRGLIWPRVPIKESQANEHQTNVQGKGNRDGESQDV